MANIIVKTHHRNQSETVLRLATEQAQVPVIQAGSHARYELINEATGLAPTKAVIRRVGKDLELSFDELNRDTDLIIQDYYSYTDQAIVGHTSEGVLLNYLPVTGETNAYTNQIINPEAYNAAAVNDANHLPFWATLGLENAWGLMLAVAPIALYVSLGSDKDDDGNKNNDKDSSNTAPVLTVTQITGFGEKDADAKAGAIIANYMTTDKDKDKVTVKLSDETYYALDAKGNITLTEKGAELIASGAQLPTFSLVPNDGKVDGNKVSINPMVNAALTVTISTKNDFIEDAVATKKGAIVATYKVAGDDSGKGSVYLSDTVNYGFDDKGNIVLTDKGAELANSGKPLPKFTLTPQVDMQAGKSATVEPKVTFVNDAPELTVTETTVFVQTDKNIKAGNIVAKYTTFDEEDGTAAKVILSDTEHYKLDDKGNVLLTQKGVDLITSGEELPAFKLTPNDNIINGSAVLVGPEINSAPVLTITKTNDLMATEGEVKAGDIVVSFKTVDVDSVVVTVKLSDEIHYALDGKGNVTLTDKGAALVNGDKPLPEFTLTPNDAAQDGADVTVTPSTFGDKATEASNFALVSSDLAAEFAVSELEASEPVIIAMSNFSEAIPLDMGATKLSVADLFSESSTDLFVGGEEKAMVKPTSTHSEGYLYSHSDTADLTEVEEVQPII